MGLLDDLKQQADALKAQDTDRTESLRGNAVAVDHALRRAFLYMNDLGKQLNVVSLPSPFVYKLPTVGEISGLTFKDFFCDFRSKHFIDKDYYGEVHVAARCWSEKVLSIKKGPDDMEKFRDILWQYNVEHKSEQYRDQRKVITHEIFEVKCDFRVQAKFEGDRKSFDQLRGMLVVFTPDFEILPGTAPKAPSEHLKPFELPDLTPAEMGGE